MINIKHQQLNFKVVVPAAGIGSRMNADLPKQYLTLAGTTIIDRTLEALLSHQKIDELLVVINKNDSYWQHSRFFNDPRISIIDGGIERYHSVLNALRSLDELVHDQEWIMVHDVVRPFINHNDLTQLINGVSKSIDGLVLGLPVRDTMKRTDSCGRVVNTISRELLWHAFTPQMFRIGQLKSAIERCLLNKVNITDEACAMEYCGFNPTMLHSSPTNFKITYPHDIRLAELMLTSLQDYKHDNN